jgi:hypothetical protein
MHRFLGWVSLWGCTGSLFAMDFPFVSKEKKNQKKTGNYVGIWWRFWYVGKLSPTPN